MGDAGSDSNARSVVIVLVVLCVIPYEKNRKLSESHGRLVECEDGAYESGTPREKHFPSDLHHR